MYKTVARNSVRLGRKTFNSPVYNNNENRTGNSKPKTAEELQAAYVKRMNAIKKSKANNKAPVVSPKAIVAPTSTTAICTETAGVVMTIRKRSNK